MFYSAQQRCHVGADKLGRCKLGLGKLGLGKFGENSVVTYERERKTRSELCSNPEILYYTDSGNKPVGLNVLVMLSFSFTAKRFNLQRTTKVTKRESHSII